MTIENTLDRIATALEKIAAGPSKQIELALPTPAIQVTESGEAVTTAVAPAPRGPGRPRKAAAPVEQKPDEDFLGGEEKAAEPAVTVDQVRAALIAYQQRVGSQEKARELLKSVGGVDNLKALSESKFGAVIAAAAKK